MIILINGSIHLNDALNTCVSALVIDQGRVIFSGSDQAALDQFPGEIIDLQQKTILPGLTDAHVHLMQLALSYEKVNCETATLQACLEAIAARAASTPAGQWVLGHGWNHNRWHEGYGSAAQLDAISTQHPIYLTAKSLHAAWANSAALHLAGIDESTSDPEGGCIMRDAQGHPSGILLENAVQLVARKISPPDENSLETSLQAVQKRLWQLGITGVHDFDGAASFRVLQKMLEEQTLKLRVRENLLAETLDSIHVTGLRGNFGNQWLHIGGLKLFADGALGPQTAAMLSPYENSTNQGALLWQQPDLIEFGKKAVRAGFSLTIHAIGDAANRTVLNAYAALRGYEQANHLPQRMHRIEHVQIIHPQDLPRLAQLNVAASVQPIHATSDYQMVDQFWGARGTSAYAFKHLLQSGAVLAFGSDAPVETVNPFVGLHAAVTRRRADGSPDVAGWHPEQCLTFHEALQGYTTAPAIISGAGQHQGRLLAGYQADLIVLENDPYNIDPMTLHQQLPVATMLNGEWVWGCFGT